MAKRKTNADKLRKMCDSDRLSAQAALDILEEWEDVREWADTLGEIAENIESAKDNIEAYQEAQGRDEKSDAREEALNSLETLLSSIINLDELHPLPDLSETPYVEEAV